MLEVALHNSRQHRQFHHKRGPLVLARDNRASAVWTPVDRGAELPDARLEIVLCPDGVSLTLAGCEAECHCGQRCEPVGNCRLPLPASFTIGDTRFEVSKPGSGNITRSLQKLRSDKRSGRGEKMSNAGPSPATLSRWFAALSSLNHWATSLQELYVQAARCAVDAIGLDGGIVLRRRDDQWEIAASYLPHPDLGINCGTRVLDELLASPQTLFHGSDFRASDLQDQPAIVVSPLRNANGVLVGAVYGYRSVRAGNGRRTIRYLEAHMIELLAGAVSEGIVRIEREAEIDRRRVLLEQAVATSPCQTVRANEREQREVTLLFADLRDSTDISTALAVDESYELLSQVMECLSAAVISHDGLVIDYYGDGLAAMWNAPADQCDHAELACRAALRMLHTLPDIASDWAHVIQRDLQLGIGIHTGVVHVGNTGSRKRAKYGPRGTNVHLTSRIESATKQVKLPLLVTGATATQLSNRFTVHRVCRAQISGFERPVELYSVCVPSNDVRRLAAWQAYGHALGCFERGELNAALDVLATIDPATNQVPASFLNEHVQAKLFGAHRRRSSDRTTKGACGAIMLAAK